MVDGTNRIATVSVSYTAAEARTHGLRWEKSASVNLGTFAAGKVIRLESRIGGTPVTQTHYTLQFCGARWLALDLPSFKALEEDLKCKVLDRSELILDIFATRAATKEARLQVEIAQLGFLVPDHAGFHPG